MENKEGYLAFNQYLRVLKLAKTPSREEFLKIAGISAIGLFLVGIIGFIIFAIMSFIPM
jgi:protein transport protein SEC61 subunit gamma-like protein